MRKGRLVPTLLALAGLWLAAGQGAATAAEVQSIKLGSVIALTGRMAAGGKDVKAGYDLAIKHINADGGVFVKEVGRKLPLELIVLDDESDPVKTTGRMEKLYSVDNVVCYLGGFSSLLNIAGLSTAEKNKVPWVGVTVAAEGPFKKGFKYIFAPFALSGKQVTTFLDLLDSFPKADRPTKIANFEEQSDWGLEVGQHLREMAKARGYQVIDQKYSPSATDFSAQILAAKAAGADAVLSTPSPPQSMQLVRQMKQLGYAPKATVLIRGPDLTTYWDSMGADAQYIISDGNWHEGFAFPKNQRLVKDFFAANPQEKSIGLPVGAAYAVVQIVADAIERAGSLDREKIRTAIQATNLVTVRGPVTFQPGGMGNVAYGFRQWQDGKNQFVFPRDNASAKLLVAPPWNKR
ncbi:MAG: amino acid ABC transporter substrate-binding protein [Deltaproteobacteria bacterium]|nr:amino acid ABC transporter substrate-binding protein [Deltaproteobacteria bacterium]